jgi:hypothetical protein
VLRVKRVYQGFQRKGFFRIGALPMGVIDGVDLEVSNPDFVDRALRHCERFHPGKALEVRNLRIAAYSTVTNELSCHSARPLARDVWQLEGDVTLVNGPRKLECARALLLFQQTNVGTVMLSTLPHSTNWLFSISDSTP